MAPPAACFAAFGLLRGTEALRTFVAAERAPVTVLAGMAGLSAGRDGVSHHCLEDLAVLRGMPAIRVYAPSDRAAARWAVEDLLSVREPAYVRLARQPVRDTHGGPVTGGLRVLRRGTGRDLVVGYGPALAAALPALEARAPAADVVEVVRLQPLPAGLAAHLRRARRVSVVEEHRPEGGLADRIRAAHAHFARRVRAFGVPEDPGSGAYLELLEAAGLTGHPLLDRLGTAPKPPRRKVS
ncbi:transketolase C-terminal domain-containing protein [Streptomyces sp. NPDC053474]|uniref:transketolase C-terminal domain-containing protein n=1 Tax=Streptomyces sp. NPDC053474 TaxID=3365704 RepID=UPI0037CD258E